MIRDDVRFVERGEVADPVAETACHEGGVFGERLRGPADRPTAGFLECLREIPVIERGERGDAMREQLIDEPVVEVEARLVRSSGSLREHPRP